MSQILSEKVKLGDIFRIKRAVYLVEFEYYLGYIKKKAKMYETELNIEVIPDIIGQKMITRIQGKETIYLHDSEDVLNENQEIEKSVLDEKLNKKLLDVADIARRLDKGMSFFINELDSLHDELITQNITKSEISERLKKIIIKLYENNWVLQEEEEKILVTIQK
ncbi:MAG: hypothetical protein ACTSWY_15860 [Promethearchaeota archaeon]